MRNVVWGSGALLAAAVCMVAVTAEERAPERLSETGLHAAGTPDVIADDVRPFSPQYALWADGAAKRRWVYLPPGAVIDASNPHEWQLPVGTRLWKEFVFGGRKVETRMIWRAARDRWVFASYLWNEAGTDATLAPEEGVLTAAEVAPGKRHSIPSVTDCGACHGTDRPGPLGFNALQLSPDRDPNAIHGEVLAPGMLTLATLIDERRIEPRSSELQAPRIRTTSPETRAMLGYLMSNCGSCHNGRGEIAAMGPTLRIEDLVRDGDRVAHALAGQATRWQVPGVSDGHSVLIDPEAPDTSAILVRMRSRRPSSQMPPLGTVVRDDDALERLANWITRLPGSRRQAPGDVAAAGSARPDDERVADGTLARGIRGIVHDFPLHDHGR